MITKYWNQFVGYHTGTINKLIHVVGFALIGVGVFEKSLSLVIAGGLTQELGHFYEYYRTKTPQSSPWACVKPQSIFAYPLFILIILYVIWAKYYV